MCAVSATIAQAQTQPTQQAPENQATQTSTPPVTPVNNNTNKASKQSGYTSGVNTGREIQFNTPGCVGPISFCNLYFGS
jgi:hypothetical protein